uniref:Uncharacterized protein n=1 Tax=Haptolina ericina TaxID=156174 RepID=A0A7S3AY64_9EUKA|mmetsp:Transcript_41717/g.94258  ORF Transcript_41717/g.94258 Transcript_41717/m.94258 type:complete len:434 (+) Transcript_41717:3-1304(+)
MAYERLVRASCVAAAQWQLGQKLGPADQKMPDLSSALNLALSNASARQPLPATFEAPRRAACERALDARVAELTVSLCGEAAAGRSLQAAAPYVEALMKAKQQVVDPNTMGLGQHIAQLKEDQLSSAVADLAGSRLRDVMKAKARTIHKLLKAAMDDVESQFSNGIRQLCASVLAPALAPADIIALSESAMAAVRNTLDVDYAYSTPLLEAQLEQRLNAQRSAMQQRAQASRRAGTTSIPSVASDPLGWLRAVVLGSALLELSADANDFLQVQTARYLDPFLDGAVPPAEFTHRSAGFFVDRVRIAWNEQTGGDDPMPVPPSLAYAQYLRHAISKLNSLHGFSNHISGLGRQPVSQWERDASLKAPRHADPDPTLVSPALLPCFMRSWPAHAPCTDHCFAALCALVVPWSRFRRLCVPPLLTRRRGISSRTTA